MRFLDFDRYDVETHGHLGRFEAPAIPRGKIGGRFDSRRAGEPGTWMRTHMAFRRQAPHCRVSLMAKDTERETPDEQSRIWNLREIEALVLQLRQEGMEPKDIVSSLRKMGITAYDKGKGKRKAIDSPAISEITHQVWSTGRLKYQPDEEQELALQISQYNRSIYSENVRVIQTAHAKHIAEAGADMLLDIMSHHKLHPSGDHPDEIKVGFCGGKTPSDLMMFLARKLARIEASRYEQYPKTMKFLSLVGSFSIPRIEVDPNAYFVYFPVAMPNGHPYFKCEFSALPVSGLVTPREYESAREFEIVKHAFDQRQSLDIICGACGHWGKGHHSTFDYVWDACGKSLRKLWTGTASYLGEHDVIGDFCWCPISPRGPISMQETPLRFFRTFDFEHLLHFVHPELVESTARPGKLLLLVSPCYGERCKQRSKGQVLDALLHAARLPPVTHIVADSASAREYCEIFRNSNRQVSSSLAEEAMQLHRQERDDSRA